ncbi:hypothetical protein [Anabaena subtropica]|uniref:Uncharacterized protein n=1 Tax=Anabaena subtropica FACHB-260 TaxID=2692884 RepID=A0ABR8CL49_9NOST|nr:hypothetical protein [Anabaena subtropica]MBD2343128.1 hypothetical protein [Anabaena subtropica FACHB-260]
MYPIDGFLNVQTAPCRWCNRKGDESLHSENSSSSEFLSQWKKLNTEAFKRKFARLHNLFVVVKQIDLTEQ